jgi:ubiquinol-cytochrome c reductase core subunit 2
MICRPALSRGSQLALRRQGAAKLAQRGFAAVASPKASYEPTSIAGVKVASRDDNGPTTRLAVVAKAGTRYEPLPGLTVGLEEFAFKAGLPWLLARALAELQTAVSAHQQQMS